MSRELRERLASTQAMDKFVELIKGISQIPFSEMYEIQALALKITYRKLRPFVVNFSEWRDDVNGTKTRENIHNFLKNLFSKYGYSELEFSRIAKVTDEGANVDIVSGEGRNFYI